MCDRPKIHVFLGAPSLLSESGGPGEDHAPAAWKNLELSWRDRRLRPTADDGSPGRSSAEEERVTEFDRRTCTSACQRDLDKDQTSDEHECSASLLEYLDSCFAASLPEPVSEHQPPPSSRTQYLTTWTLSQALVLRRRRGIQSGSSPEELPPPETSHKPTQTPPSISSSTPELFSSLTPSPVASSKQFSQPHRTPRAEEGGIIFQSTTDGMLCSQESVTTFHSPSGSPSSKKARMYEDSRTEVTKVQACSLATTSGLHGPTTLLHRCNSLGARYSVLVAVVHPCHLKEVKVKTGPSAGSSVPLASVVVTDQSAVEMKVVLWRRAAFWALTVGPGEVLLITGLRLTEDRWRGETVLQSSFGSTLLNLGRVAAAASPRAPRGVDAGALSCLCGFLRERRPLLVSLPCRPHQDLSRLPYANLRSLRVDTLVHARLRVTHTHISPAWRSEADSRCRSAVQLKAVVTVVQADGQQGALVLWGAAVDWLQGFRRDRDAVWDVRVLLVREGLSSDLLELHSTPWSSARPLEPSTRRAQDYIPASSRAGSTLELDLDTLLSQKHSGDVELGVQVTAFHFQDVPPSQNAPQPVMDSSTPLAGILEALSGDVTFTGCGRCCSELDTDANGIYRPCYPCLPRTAVRRYYRSAVLVVRGRGSRQVRVQVPPLPLQKILEAPPDKLHRSSVPGSEVKHIQVAAERIQSLLSLPRKTFIITMRSHFLCDENSIPIRQDFTLLDLQSPD